MIYREDTSVSARREEIEIKLSRVRNLLHREEKKALVLMRQNNFSWITAGGKDQVTIYLEAGVATILITETAQYAITSIIEEARMREEEKLEALGFKIISQPWYEDKTAQIVADLVGDDCFAVSGVRLLCDGVFPDKCLRRHELCERDHGESSRYRDGHSLYGTQSRNACGHGVTD